MVSGFDVGYRAIYIDYENGGFVYNGTKRGAFVNQGDQF